MEKLEIILETVNGIIQDKSFSWNGFLVTDTDYEMIWCDDAVSAGINESTYDLQIKTNLKGCKAEDDCQIIEWNGEKYLIILTKICEFHGETHYVFGLKDMTDIKLMWLELLQSKKKTRELNGIIESSFDGMYITDKKGKTLMVNKAHERITGIERKKLIGKNIAELVDQGIFSAFITETVVLNKKPVTIEQYVNNSEKKVLITGSPIFDFDGNVEMVITNVRDITELKSLEEKVERIEAAAERYKQEFVGGDALNENIAVGKNSLFSDVLKYAAKVALKDSTVLITGETGTGKEIIAKYIFSHSKRANKEFIKVNCGAIQKNLLEAELFGYVKGAFTGADSKGKLGLFELADGGTLFLDEIGELPLDVQASLLRVLQEGELIRVGDTKVRKVDVRIVAATNRNLEEMVSRGEFRSDLYYRLAVISIEAPPLRERKEDIPAITYMVVDKLNKKYKEDKTVGKDFIFALCNMDWPGNVRQLENYIEKHFILSESNVIGRPEEKKRGMQEQFTLQEIMPLKEAVELVERDLLERAMEQGGTTYKAAELLGISQPTFFRKYQKLCSK